jgi:hypothetical protein
MPARDPEVRTISSRIAATERHHPDTDTSALRRDLRVAQLAAHIRRVVDAAPPLSGAQRDRLAVLLRSGGDAA